MIKPRVEILAELFHVEHWQALKEEIKINLANAERKLKLEGVIDRSYLAGECTGYERILALEDKYKNADDK